MIHKDVQKWENASKTWQLQTLNPICLCSTCTLESHLTTTPFVFSTLGKRFVSGFSYFKKTPKY